jgi:hypothetical protein
VCVLPNWAKTASGLGSRKLAARSGRKSGAIEPGLRKQCASFSLHPDREERDACRRRQGETVRLRDALKRLFSEVFTDVSLAPIPFTIAMAASAMPATIRQFSIAVTPDSLARNFQNIFIEPFVGVEPIVGVKPEEAIKPSGKIRPIPWGMVSGWGGSQEPVLYRRHRVDERA